MTTNTAIAEIKVSYSRNQQHQPTITSSKDAYEIFQTVFDPETIDYHETFFVILLSRSNHVLGYRQISQGGLSQTVVDPKTVFAPALVCAASAIILAHNHPSGNLKPSQVDINLTDKIKSGAQLLDLQILDHIIITSTSYFSFADEGLL